jgi:thioredoxin-like negative regulator of GroEL
LKDETFDDALKSSRNPLMVLFYAGKDADPENFPKLKKTYAGVSEKVQKYVTLAAVDCSKNEMICTKLETNKAPFTYLFFADKEAKPEALFGDWGEGVFPEDNDFMNAVARGTGNNRWDL